MQPRNLLRTQLLKAWKKTIDNQYQEQLINSERGLQVYFCSALLDIFWKNPLTKNKRRIFVEPRLSVGPTDYRYPDIVICNTRRIIGVVEIKYLPRGRPIYQKDIDTLNWIAQHPKELSISNDRFRGNPDKIRNYSLAEDAVLSWGGVYQGNQADIVKLPNRFLGLHAVTTRDNEHVDVSDSN